MAKTETKDVLVSLKGYELPIRITQTRYSEHSTVYHIYLNIQREIPPLALQYITLGSISGYEGHLRIYRTHGGLHAVHDGTLPEAFQDFLEDMVHGGPARGTRVTYMQKNRSSFLATLCRGTLVTPRLELWRQVRLRRVARWKRHGHSLGGLQRARKGVE